MSSIIERYLSLPPPDQTLVRAACAVSDARALSVLRLDFPDVTPAELQTLKEHIASQKRPT